MNKRKEGSLQVVMGCQLPVFSGVSPSPIHWEHTRWCLPLLTFYDGPPSLSPPPFLHPLIGRHEGRGWAKVDRLVNCGNTHAHTYIHLTLTINTSTGNYKFISHERQGGEGEERKGGMFVPDRILFVFLLTCTILFFFDSSYLCVLLCAHFVIGHWPLLFVIQEKDGLLSLLVST